MPLVSQKKPTSKTGFLPLMPPFAATLFCKFRQIKKICRKRLGVESIM